MSPRKSQAGFTLVEMLAVLLILSILMGVLLTSMGGAKQSAEASLTSARISEIAAVLGSYEGETGDYPRSTFDDALSASGAEYNRGIEALVLAIYSAPFDGMGLNDDMLGNIDGDSVKGIELFELVDLWGNPLAYFRRSDYGKKQSYLTEEGDTGVDYENEVSARKHPITGRWANRQSFQILSAGIDGIFGTDDDLGNFKMPEID